MNLKKIKKSIKRFIANVLAFPLVSGGYIASEARKWVIGVYRSYKNSLCGSKYSLSQVRWAVSKGFLPARASNLGITEENCKNTISQKDYAFLRPLNGIYSKWITDIVSVHTIFKPFRSVMPTCFYQISKRDSEMQIIPLQDKNAGDEVADIIELLKEKKRLKIKRSAGSLIWTLSYRDPHFYVNGKKVGLTTLENHLHSFGGIGVITEDISAADAFVGGNLRLVIFNEHGDDPTIGDAYIRFRKVRRINTFDEAEKFVDPIFDSTSEYNENSDNDRALFYHIDKKTGNLILADSCQNLNEFNPTTGKAIPQCIPCWKEITDTVDRMCRFAPQLEFFGLDIVITEDGFRIMRLLNHPAYPHRILFSKETSAYLMKKKLQKKEAYTFTKICQRGFNKLKLAVRAAYCRLFFPKSLLPYLSIRWFQEQKKDFLTNKDTTLKEKIWAVKHGFISYRLHQYGITKDNWKNFISDFEYKWLRHINNKYRHWMEDKITVKYICSEYNHCFPEYYYHISLKNGKNKVLPMMDCPAGYEGTYEDIFRLVEEKGSLALKPDEGSHGNGFFKFAYYDGKYYLNHKEAEKQDVLDILQSEENQYLVTEYIDMHPEIKRIYDGAVNTIRMIVFKKDGKNPQIGNAYMRFGSTRTGAVDNMGAGGMYARIDVETGRFYDAKIIESNEIKPCLYHPDTNEKIEGYLPNWEKVKKEVLDVARNIPQLEYFGFDLALTPDGLKFPEINRFPDYPAIEKYSPATIDYLLYKLDVKKKSYGYDVNRGHTLIKLPDRS